MDKYKPELVKCSKCGSAAELRFGVGGYTVDCVSGYCWQTPYYPEPEIASGMWNELQALLSDTMDTYTPQKIQAYHAEFKGKLGAPIVIRAPKTLEQLGAAMDAIISEFRASVSESENPDRRQCNVKCQDPAAEPLDLAPYGLGF